MIKSREKLKKQLKNSLITSNEAAELFEVTRQRFSAIAKSRNIESIYHSSQGSLYLRNEIEEALKGTKRITVKKEPLFKSQGSTQQAIKDFESKIINMKEITHIFVYFDWLDAVLDNHFIVTEGLEHLKKVTSARLIIRDIENNEIWFDNLNCGYGGTGPSGTYRVLQQLGISDELAILAKSNEYDMVKFFRNDSGEFEVYKRRSEFNRATDSSVGLYYRSGNIVGLQSPREDFDNTSLKCLNEYSSLITNLKDVIVFNSKEQAKSMGYYKESTLGDEITYQVIFRDYSGKELWLLPVVDDSFPLKHQPSVKELLEHFGFEIEEHKPSFTQKILNLLNQKAEIRTYEILKLENE